jgi:polyhydroxyalkanoate synthesis regulator phasin
LPAPKRSSSGSQGPTRSARSRTAKPRAAKPWSAKPRTATASAPKRSTAKRTTSAAAAKTAADGLANAAEQLTARVISQLDLVMLTRERIQATLDDAAERGRVTRTDANALVAELVNLGRQQTDDLIRDLEQLLGRGLEQIGSATRRARRAEPVDRLVRGADRARRTVGVGPTFPILGYDELTGRQVVERIGELSPPQLRTVREYERRHGNRKTVLAALERALA